MIALERLNRVDWNFPRAGNNLGSIHGLHWFPGNFIPQIPAALIQVLSNEGEIVFDPFGGSGTTAIEALRLNRDAIISDRLSPSLLITKAKLSFLRGRLSPRDRGEILSLFAFEHECVSNEVGINGEGSNVILNEWFSPYTLAQLRYLWKITESQIPDARNVMAGIFSGVLFDCASTGGSLTRSGKLRRHHWGWIADNVRPKSLIDHNAITLFSQRLKALDAVQAFESSTIAYVCQQDARALAMKDASVDLVVTSPPYVGVIDYAGANRLLYAWMNWSMTSERTSELGARYRRARSDVVIDYISDMTKSRDEIARVLKRGSFCAVIIGASRSFPEAVGQVVEIFSELMPIVWGPMERVPSRRRVSDRAASQSMEYICIFKKP